MLSGEHLEKEEFNRLSPFACFSAKTKGRKFTIPHSKYRTEFQRDRDRILHSQAFRKLEYKTQVFVNHEADYYRTRLTHTLEVASIGRSIAKSLKANQDLTEAIAFAHDIGHTPFGHAGEMALHDIMDGSGGFEHNSQSLRIVEYLEDRYAEYKGLNLTYEVREGIIKHHTAYDSPDNAMLKDYEPNKNASVEAQIINVADEIAYNSHDLDDGIESGLININQLLEVPLFKEFYDKLNVKDLCDKHLRYAIVKELIGAQIFDVVKTTLENIKEMNIKSLGDVRNTQLLVNTSKEMQTKNNVLKSFLFDNLYSHYKVLKMQHKAERYIRELFTVYEKDIRQLPPSYLNRVDSDGKKRVICDYIAGMTDRFAQEEYMRLFLPYEKM